MVVVEVVVVEVVVVVVSVIMLDEASAIGELESTLAVRFAGILSAVISTFLVLFRAMFLNFSDTREDL